MCIRDSFLICFLALTIYRYLEKKLDSKYTCEELLDTLKAMNFAEIQEQGFIPLYKRCLLYTSSLCRLQLLDV